MTLRITRYLIVMTTVGIIAFLGCGRDTSTLQYATFDDDPIVFTDDFGPGVGYQAFLWSDVYALDVDRVNGYKSTGSLIVRVPDFGSNEGGFAGGTFVANVPRDLSGYDALTFWARASRPEILDVVGLANDNTGTSKYVAWWEGVPVGTNWEKYIVPIPLPARLAAERGLFFFADAVPEDSSGYTVWFDDVRFDLVGGITNPRPSMITETISTFVGDDLEVNGTKVIFDVKGSDQTIGHLPGYFTFYSSDEEVVAVTDGELRVVGDGERFGRSPGRGAESDGAGRGRHLTLQRCLR
jgi:hypothetical protein